jgi:hypothetical protein
VISCLHHNVRNRLTEWDIENPTIRLGPGPKVFFWPAWFPISATVQHLPGSSKLRPTKLRIRVRVRRDERDLPARLQARTYGPVFEVLPKLRRLLVVRRSDARLCRAQSLRCPHGLSFLGNPSLLGERGSKEITGVLELGEKTWRSRINEPASTWAMMTVEPAAVDFKVGKSRERSSREE